MLPLLFLLFRAAPAAYGGSQARDPIRAAAAGLHHSHSHARSQPHLWPTCSLWQCRILNPLSEARDRTFILMDTSRVLNLLNHSGNSLFIYFFFHFFRKHMLSETWSNIHQGPFYAKPCVTSGSTEANKIYFLSVLRQLPAWAEEAVSKWIIKT